MSDKKKSPCLLPPKVATRRGGEVRHYTILVTGMNAKEDDKYTDIYRGYNHDPANVRDGLAMIRCDNPKESSVIADILKSVCRVHLDPASSYVRKVRATLKRKMKTGVPITLLGYSYGGSAVERALEPLREAVESDKTDDTVASYFHEKKLRAFAFGSIHVADTPATVFPVKNFLFEDDWPSISCNHVDVDVEKERRSGRVTVLPPPPEAAAIKSKFERGIELHKSYPVRKAFPRNDPPFKKMLGLAAKSKSP